MPRILSMPKNWPAMKSYLHSRVIVTRLSIIPSGWFNSPGGELAGLFATVQAITDFSKPIKAIVRGQASSAAYALAAANDSIETVNKSDSVGSVGIMAIFDVDENKVAVASTKAPKKAPDVSFTKKSTHP